MASLLRFLVVGIINTAVGLGIIFAGLHLGLSDYSANAAGYGVGMVVSYLLQRRWAFAVRRVPHLGEGLRFCFSAAIAYTINLMVIFIAKTVFGLERSSFVQTCAFGTYTAVFYGLSRFFVFSQTRENR